MRLWHRALAGLATASAAAVLAPAALADSPVTNPTLTEPGGNSAAQTQPLQLALTFNNDSGDTPKTLSLNLPVGLLTNTSLPVATGSSTLCIDTPATPSSPPPAGCDIGSGTVSVTALGGLVNTDVAVDFYLVQAPAGSPGDLAGIEVYNPSGELAGLIPAQDQIGSTGDVFINPDGSASIKLGIPNTATALGASQSITVNSISSTFNALRYPATCPSPAANVTGSTTSWNDPSPATPPSFSMALPVTGCSGLPYSPTFSASATRDSADKGVAVTTDITQSASEAPNENVSLSFPTNMFGANLQTLPNLCANPASGTCKPVGSVTAQSPLYPNALSGSAYLSGNANGPTLVLVFPPPFPLTLTGQVDLNTNTASFTGLPDIPLSDLKVALNGGANSLFVATCQASSGTASASLSGQNGATAALTSPISYSGCPAANPPKGNPGTGSTPPGKGGSGPGNGGSGSNPGGGSKPGVSPTTTAKIVSKSIKGLAKGKPSLTFRVKAGKQAPKLTRLTVKLPSGLSFRSHKQGKAKTVAGVSLKGAKAKSSKLAGGRLQLAFKQGSRSITVKLNPKALKESKALRAKAEKKKLKSLLLRVTARNAKGKSKALRAKITKLNLG